ncbi:MAG TPA: hypothetical protein VJP77_02425 [Planctomycetota bacterium]|nr:hypothetical protein [Planctomycetota bacterium]
MTTRQDPSQPRSTLRRAAVAVLLGALACAASADEAENPGGNPFSADETVGTLPAYWEEDPWVFALNYSNPSLLLEYGMLSYEVTVPVEEYDECLFLDAKGKGFVLMSLVGAGCQDLRLRFFGDVRVVVDLGALEACGGELALGVGGAFHGVTADMTWKGTELEPIVFGASGGTIGLAVADDPLLGMLEQAPLYLSALSPYGFSAVSGLSVKGRELTLIQVSKPL